MRLKLYKEENIMSINFPPIFEFVQHESGFWFRFFGYGLSIVDNEKRPDLFGVRYGYQKAIHISHFTVTRVKPIKQ